jgi:predicted ribosome quality control (RQC) complex YloA/Tae2 family protein
MRYFEETIDTIDISILYIAGKNAKENQQLTLESLNKDLWFHLADYPSAHLVCKINDQEFTRIQLVKIVERGARLLKSISNKQKSMPNLSVHYTYMENVENTDVDGLVNITSFKTIII